LIERCAEYLRRLEERLEEGMVTEVDAFVARCGCVGVVFMLRGVRLDDVTDGVIAVVQRAAREVGADPDIMYARVVPGTDLVIDLGARTLCETCEREFSGEEPRPDLRVLRGGR